MLKALRTIFSVFILILAITQANGQVATGNYPFGTFDSKGVDTINVGNLNVHMTIPVFQKPGRGLSFAYQLNYDSSVWQIASVSGQPTWNPVQNWGWLAQTVVGTGYISYSTHTYVCDWPPPKHGSYYIYDTFVYHDAFGVSHSFGGTNYNLEYDPTGCDSTVSSFTYTATDGSGLTLNATRGGAGPNVTQKILSRSGVTTYAPVGPAANGSTITDSNGNQISVSAAGVFTDTTGATAMTVSGTAPSPVSFTYPTLTSSAAYVMKYVSKTVQTDFGCSGVSEYSSTNVPLVSEIDLPDSSKYQFTYEVTPNNSNAVTGRLASVTLPTGGVINYTYTGGSHGIVCADGSTAGLTRTLSSDSPASAWTYARTSGTGTSHTDVTDGLGNQLKYDFVQAGNIATQYYETNRSVYQGAASGAPALSKQTCFNAAAVPCTTTAIALPVSQIDTFETRDGSETRSSRVKINSYGLQTERDDYDFGTSATAHGTLLRQEKWIYGGPVVNLVTEDDVYDGSANLAGKTLSAYDGSTPVGSTGVPQHISVSGARGNLTSLTQYASSTVSYASTATYEDTGSLLTTTSPTGTTTLSYDSTFTSVTGAALPTPSSGISLGTGASYDTTNTGRALSTTDVNGQVTTLPVYDSMLRLKEIDFPDTGKITMSYSPTQTSQYVYQTASVSSDTESQFDGYGRPSRTELAKDAAGTTWYQRDTCYDANGNRSFSSYPYQGTGFGTSKICSGAGDTYTYDVLGRLTTITRGNGEVLSYSYRGRATQSIDENSVTRITQIDGLGRTKLVCEITSTTMKSSGAPVSCGTDIAGTGYLTSYSYALATPTTTITSSTPGGVTQTRIFKSDWLGRATSITEPEVSTVTPTTFSYAYNSTGLLVTRQRPKANQTSATTLTTTSTQYDSVGRPVSINYDDGTPTKTFAYDASAGWSDLSQGNLKGRLSKASVPTASTIFNYDTMGRVKDLDECLPSECGTMAYNHKLHYNYDLAGDLTSSTDAGGVTTTYTLSRASELLTMTSSLNNSTNPPNLISNMQDGSNGPLSYNLGNGLQAARSYDSIGRAYGGWVCRGSTQAFCNGGTQVYGNVVDTRGSQAYDDCDTAQSVCVTNGYDEFNRLTSITVGTGIANNFTYVYDRYGNRWQQNVTAGSGPQPQFSFNLANNHIISAGYAYDATGNLVNDTSHSYTYDADGNMTKVDGGSTAQYTYNALNQRVNTTVGTTVTNFVFNTSGQRVSMWDGSSHLMLKGQYYWGTTPVAYYNPGGQIHFQHQDWLGTERMRTTYNGNSDGTYTSLPFGDAKSSSGTDGDAYHFASLDYDSESNTDHAQYRQYSNTQGRWLRPDPYYGSYFINNPQSFNRYSYALNQPLSGTDPLGLEPCTKVADPSVAHGLGGVHASESNDDPCDGSGDGDGGGGGGGSGDVSQSGGYTAPDGTVYPPGTIVQDTDGNKYEVGADGRLYSVYSETGVYSGPLGCFMNSLSCQLEYALWANMTPIPYPHPGGGANNQNNGPDGHLSQDELRTTSPSSKCQQISTNATIKLAGSLAAFLFSPPTATIGAAVSVGGMIVDSSYAGCNDNAQNIDMSRWAAATY